jgi:hypothetical protein
VQAVEAGIIAERIEMSVTRHVVDACARVLTGDGKAGAVAIVPPTRPPPRPHNYLISKKKAAAVVCGALQLGRGAL